MKLRRVSEATARGQTRHIFKEIKQLFGIENIPLLFQYIASSESYLIFIWERIFQNAQTDQFQSKQKTIIDFSDRAVRRIYQPTNAMNNFVSSFSESDREKILGTINGLVQLNSILLLISFALRESIKGIPLEQLLLEEKKDIMKKLQQVDGFRDGMSDFNFPKSFETMLTAFFDDASIQILPFAQFFHIVSQEVEDLAEKETYLATRVGLEQIAQLSIKTFPYPMNSSYRELADMIPDSELLYEILYILKHRFPATLPHQLLTSVIMKQIIIRKSGLVVS